MSDDPSIRVLLVDDELLVLEALERQLSLDYDISTANSGFEALRLLRDEDPFDVIISDMRMPRMTGAVFFSRARELWPDTARVLLTGYADATDAADAINRGSIFRYLNKPCDAARLSETIQAAAAHTAGQRSERVLLEQTLQGMVSVLSEIVSFIDPESFEDAGRVRALATGLARELELNDTWQLELAATIYPVCRAFDVADGHESHHGTSEPPATATEIQLMRAAGLFEQVPRLDGVGRILAALAPERALPLDDVERLSAEILRFCVVLRQREQELGDTDRGLVSAKSSAPERLHTAMERVLGALDAWECRVVPVDELEAGMILDQDVKMDGKMLATRGQRLTLMMCRRLDDIRRRGLIAPTLDVVIRGVHAREKACANAS